MKEIFFEPELKISHIFGFLLLRSLIILCFYLHIFRESILHNNVLQYNIVPLYIVIYRMFIFYTITYEDESKCFLTFRVIFMNITYFYYYYYLNLV